MNSGIQMDNQSGRNNKSLHDSNSEQTTSITDNVYDILEDFLESNADARMIKIDKDFEIYYFKTLSDEYTILQELKQKYFEDTFSFDFYFFTISEPLKRDNIIRELHDGSVVALYKGKIYSLKDPESKVSRPVSTTLRESSLEGGLEGFVENLVTNINLIRQLYQHPSLRGEHLRIGKLKTSKVALLYDTEFFNKEHLNFIKGKLENIDLPIVQAGNQLSQHIEEGQWIIPRMLTTERPDRVVENLLKGRIIIILDGTPAVLIAPVTFHDFMSTVDDRYVLPLPALFLVCLRYLALFISILFPASYVAFTTYNPEVYRVELALTIAGSRINVPYPAFLEVFFMLVMMEFLIEASIRLPKTIGQAAATVGGLILGQAATQAQLVSSIMIIIVAAVAISNFVVPVTSFGLTIRLTKYILLFFATISGMYGMLIGFLWFIFYLFSLNSLSEPFFNPIGVNFKRILSRLRRGNF